MKKPQTASARNRILLFIILLLLQLSMTAQLQWYQNQDGQLQPNGTYATSIRPFGSSAFIACYLWTIGNDQYTWKISKTTTGGHEQKKFFLTGATAMVEARVGRYNTVYVLLRDFPFGQNPVYTLYKLNSNLQVLSQGTISFPGDFNIFNLNAFELDESDNVYVAGDGQYPDGPGYSPASFVIKTDKHLALKWKFVDSTETSFSRLHIEQTGKVVVLEDHYATYPNIRITKISSNGLHMHRRTAVTDPGRMSLFSKLDKNDNLLLYGVKNTNSGEQAIYLRKLSKYNSHLIYHRTHFVSPGIALNDLELDKGGAIYTLVTKYAASGESTCRISRIGSSNGQASWNRSMPFSQDSCLLTALVMGRNERFYAIGERRSQAYYSKGFAIRMRKNGIRDGNFPAPDSVAFQRSHILMDGVVDHDNRLVALGNTNDFDTLTYSSTYYRAFTARFGINPGNGGGNGCEEEFSKAGAEPIGVEQEREETGVGVTVYPNPAENELKVSNLATEGYDQLTVYNMQGIAVIRKSVNGSTVRVDVSNLPDGIYVLYLRSSASRKEHSRKFVVKR